MKSKPSDRTKAREYKRGLINLTSAVTFLLTQLDAVMKQPESHVRGQKIAALANELELHNDLARQVLGTLRRKR